MKRHFLLIALIAALGSVIQARAADRNCPAAERAQADARQAEIANSSTLRKQLIQRHPRFGAPDATLPTAHERALVQDGYVMDHDDDLKDPRIPLALTGEPLDYDEARCESCESRRRLAAHLLLLFAGAAVSYAGGFMVGFGLFELAFWRRLFKRNGR